MAKITLKGDTITTSGQLPALGSKAPDFILTKPDLTDVTLSDFPGLKKILNIVPSLDTSVCAKSVQKFNAEAAARGDTVVLTVSCDLPFAAKRFCELYKIDRVITLSELRSRAFGENYGCRISSGPLTGLLSRALVVLDEDNTVVWTQQVPEIAQEPDYDGALKALA